MNIIIYIFNTNGKTYSKLKLETLLIILSHLLQKLTYPCLTTEQYSLINIITKLPPTNYAKAGIKESTFPKGVEINVNLCSSLTCRNCKWNRWRRGLICFAARRKNARGEPAVELDDPIRAGTCWHESCAKYSTRGAIWMSAWQLVPLCTVVADIAAVI